MGRDLGKLVGYNFGMSVREAIEKSLIAAFDTQGKVALQHTDDWSHGDYATGLALALAKKSGISPVEYARQAVEKMGAIEGVSKIEIAGPGFINFTLAPGEISQSVAYAANDDWGRGMPTDARILFEYTDPNPFKVFHIGHLMSNAIGEALSRLSDFAGAKVTRANYQGDVGPHVAKAIWGVQKLGVDPSDSNKLGEAYAAGAQAYESDESAKAEIDIINARVYDRSDSTVNEIYDKGRAASLEHFEELYKILGTKFDHYFFESVTAPKGLEIVRANSSVFEESDGAVVYKGESEGLHTRVFITSKGLPTYETKDLGLAKLKAETMSFDSSITITAHEQSDYFKVVLAAMRKVLPDIAAKTRHIAHGMMRFAEGKMSSRTGNIITGESLIIDLIDAARERASESRADDKDELARDVAVAAIKYQILKQGISKDIIFDRDRALSLEGDSGPYVQYAHARAHQITVRAKSEGVDSRIDFTAQPSDLARLLHRFPEVVEQAAELMEPHIVTTYLTQLASAYNSWYAQEQILDGTPHAAHKVAVVNAVRQTLKNGLWILGIPAPEKM